jgi:hypothetical protein
MRVTVNSQKAQKETEKRVYGLFYSNHIVGIYSNLKLAQQKFENETINDQNYRIFYSIMSFILDDNCIYDYGKQQKESLI